MDDAVAALERRDRLWVVYMTLAFPPAMRFFSVRLTLWLSSWAFEIRMVPEILRRKYLLALLRVCGHSEYQRHLEQ